MTVVESMAWGLAVAALAFVVLLIWRTQRRARRRRGAEAKAEAERQPEHRAALASLLRWQDAELPQLGNWKITPDFACLLAETVRDARPARTLELGAGASTIVIARALQILGHGKVLSLEQDAAHAEATRADLRARGLEAIASVVHAPLQAWPQAREGEPEWFSPAALHDIPEPLGPPWDLVIVDGPSTVERADARWPALPRLIGTLAQDAIVLLDDAARPGERAIVAAWRGMGLLAGFDIETIPLARGAVILRRKP